MNYRSVAIRVLYFSLVFAALTGVSAVFVPSSTDTLIRLLATALATGFAASIMLLAVRAIENPMTRPAGSTIGIIISIVYPLVFSVIWLDAISSIRSREIENIALSALIIFLSGFPLILGAACITHKKLRLSGKLLIISWVILPVIWIIAVWSTSFGSEIYIEAIANPIAWCSPIAALLLITWPRHIISLVLISIACVLWQWYGIQAKHNWATFSTPLAIILITAWFPCTNALLSLLTIRKKTYRIRWLEITAVSLGSIAIATSFTLFWTTEIHSVSPDLLVRAAIASSILGGTSILGVFITQVLKRSMLVIVDGVAIKSTCPRCHEELNIPQGKSACPNCNLRFKLLFESPNCRNCEFDLTHTQSGRCPECGEGIATNAEN